MEDLVYRRSLGRPVDPEAVKREVEGGMSPRYVDRTNGLNESSEFTDIVLTPETEVAWMLSQSASKEDLESSLRSDVEDIRDEYIVKQQDFNKIADEHPLDVARAVKMFRENHEQMKHDGKPVTAEMDDEAHEVARAIVGTNPDKSVIQLLEIAQYVVDLSKVEQELKDAETRLAILLAA